MATRGYIRIGAVVIAAVFLAALLPIMGLSREADEVREIRLVARDMTYYVEGQKEANPALKLRAGERVKVVLRNEDEGMEHDFTVRAWEVAIPIIEGKGSNSVTFTVPHLRGSHGYSCTPHPSSMRGVIVIE